MKIQTIDVFKCDLPYSGGTYTLSGGRTYSSFDATIVRIQTACGIEGWGESTPFGSNYIDAHARGVRAGIEELAPVLLGQDPREPDSIARVMDKALKGHNHAKTALDVACWDVFGKSTGLPVCTLLGGSTKVPMPLISSIHSGTPEDMRNRVQMFRERGYRGHSIKVGRSESDGGSALDAECVRACLCDRQPGEYFLVDANGSMTAESALRFVQLLGPIDVVFEAPCATWSETLKLREQCSLPIVLDELIQYDSDVISAIANQCADGIGLKISKAGGLTAGRRQRDICTAAGLTMSVQDTVGSDIAFAAIAHLGQTVSPKLLRCILDTRDMVSQTTGTLACSTVNGSISVGDVPGLGINVNRDVLRDPVQRYST